MTVFEWADRHRFLSSLAASEAGPYRNSRAPYIKAIMDALSPSQPKGKTGTVVPVPLHPAVLASIGIERAARRKAAIVAAKRPLLTNSRGTPCTPAGFGASWTKELIRLKLRPATVAVYAKGAFQPAFHGLRHTKATMIANAVVRNPDIFGGIDRAKSMLGHIFERMAKHYTRRTKGEYINAATILLIPEIGNTPDWIGNTEAD